ncbi:hypothetical protein SAMN04487896_5138 [Paenibacillus sp. ov031]|uniref:hypothetical protein n=1 Tax=Paenibacillus sp. ov031 TaxID=1761879 RepID=UPI00091896CD|nr:hypothetical protein [Paenibacillus sp. ov031]SHN82689.1 hypothetical protein SAMN04487896_5138 [Paenibacillus sp. ov031]
MRTKSLKLITVGVIFALGIGIGVYGWGAASANTSPSEDQMEINDKGETYGSFVYHDGKEIDLVKAIGVNGTEGYIKTSDMNQDLPQTPEEAIQSMNELKVDKYINLYDSNENIIGKFLLESSED